MATPPQAPLPRAPSDRCLSLSALELGLILGACWHSLDVVGQTEMLACESVQFVLAG